MIHLPIYCSSSWYTCSAGVVSKVNVESRTSPSCWQPQTFGVQSPKVNHIIYDSPHHQLQDKSIWLPDQSPQIMNWFILSECWEGSVLPGKLALHWSSCLWWNMGTENTWDLSWVGGSGQACWAYMSMSPWTSTLWAFVQDSCSVPALYSMAESVQNADDGM